MITQQLYIDDNEETGVYDFLNGIIEEHHLRDFYPQVEMRTRLLNYDMQENHATDDRIVQLVVDNRLVAFSFLRRNDGNYTEVNNVFNEEALEKCRIMREEIDKKIEEQKRAFSGL